MTTVSVLGAGAWGSALALVAARAGSETLLWTRREEEAQFLQSQRKHPSKLSGIHFDAPLNITTDLEEACHANVIILAVPVQEFRGFTTVLKSLVSPKSYFVIAAKGIELQTGMLLSEVCSETLPEYPFSILSGPSFAEEVANNLPTAVTLASTHVTTSNFLAKTLSHPTFRIYGSVDPTGVQLGGALKNVLAIAAGILNARGLGANAQAVLITRGLAEITRLGLAKGAQQSTFSGLSGLGDICLSCTSPKSRNFAFGYELGRTNSIEQALENFQGKTVEGIATAASVQQLATRLNVEMPLCKTINAILHEGCDIGMAIEELLARPVRAEEESDLRRSLALKNKQRDQRPNKEKISE